MFVVECCSLNKIYCQGDFEVVGFCDVDFVIESGEFICFFVFFGGGKMILFNVIGGFDQLDSGEIMIDGVCVDMMSKVECVRLRFYKIGFVFQVYNLILVLLVSENVEFVMQVQGFFKEE